MLKMCMDRFDIEILDQLQRDAGRTNAQLAEKVHMSPSQISRRRAALEGAGYIKGYKAQLDDHKLGFEIDVFIRVALSGHSNKTAEQFTSFLRRLDAVKSAYAISGDADYLLHVKARSLTELSEIISRDILPHTNIREVRSEIVLECLKDNGLLPIKRRLAPA